MTTLDPVRADRARRMVLDESSWPGDRLCMKRMTSPMQFGVILKGSAVSGHIEIIEHPGVEPFSIVFASIEELVAAGWTVD